MRRSSLETSSRLLFTGSGHENDRRRDRCKTPDWLLTVRKQGGKLRQLLMPETNDPNQIVAGLGVGFLILAGLWRLIAWVREAPQRPDPWDAETERRLEEPEAMEICHRCFNPQPPNAWFCEHCGGAVGPYNNLMPYLNVFSEGEVFRNGTAGRLRANPVIIAGYLLLSLSAYAVLAPIFWVFLIRNLKRPREEQPDRQPEGHSS